MNENKLQQQQALIGVSAPQLIQANGQIVCQITVSGSAWREVMALGAYSAVREVRAAAKTNADAPLTFHLILDIDTSDEIAAMDAGWNVQRELMRLLPLSPHNADVAIAHKHHVDEPEYFESFVYEYPPSVAHYEFGLVLTDIVELQAEYLEDLEKYIKLLRGRITNAKRKTFPDEVKITQLQMERERTKQELAVLSIPPAELFAMLQHIYEYAAQIEKQLDFTTAVSMTYAEFISISYLVNFLGEVLDQPWSQYLSEELTQLISIHENLEA